MASTKNQRTSAHGASEALPSAGMAREYASDFDLAMLDAASAAHVGGAGPDAIGAGAPLPGGIAPLDGNAPPNPALQSGVRILTPRESARAAAGLPAVAGQGVASENPFGANNEYLEDAKPELVNALRELVVMYREEGIVARRHEIRRIRQARLFWQGMQYAWWNPTDMTWHLPYESKIYDDRAMQEMPRYQFVTNIYQAFGLSFISVISQDVPATRFYPQSAQSLADITAAKAASQVADLVEQNNRVQNLLTGVGFFLWTDGKAGGYVRYVADGQRFGFHDEPMIEEHYVPLGEDEYVCPECGSPRAFTASGAEQRVGDGPGTPGSARVTASENSRRDSSVGPTASALPQNDNETGPALLSPCSARNAARRWDRKIFGPRRAWRFPW